MFNNRSHEKFDMFGVHVHTDDIGSSSTPEPPPSPRPPSPGGNIPNGGPELKVPNGVPPTAAYTEAEDDGLLKPPPMAVPPPPKAPR